MTKVAPFDVANPTFAGDGPRPAGASWWRSSRLVVLWLILAFVATILVATMVLYTLTRGTPYVQLASAAVSSGNASSLLVDADWLLTFHVAYEDTDSYPDRYGPVEASVLYGGLEVAEDRLPPFSVGSDSTFNLRLRPTAAARDSKSVQVVAGNQ